MSDGSESGLSGECIGGTADRSQAVIHQVRVDHGGLDVLMAHQFLDHADVVTGFQEVRGEGVAKRMLTVRGRLSSPHLD